MLCPELSAMYLLCAWLAVIQFIHCSAFNMAVKHATVIPDPARDDNSYFGYTLEFRKYEASQPRLIVGAPRGTYYRNITRTGLVYECSVDANDTCYVRELETIGDVSRRDIKENTWIGGTIAVQDETEGNVVICGFRVKTKSHLMPGMCHFLKNKGEFERLKPVQNYFSYVEGQKPESVFIHAISQAGFSAHFVPGKNQLLVGAPGTFYWGGELIVYHQTEKRFGSSLVRDFGSPSANNMSAISETYSYAGYAVASGRFHDNRNIISYIVGAPRALRSTCTGHVLIMNTNINNSWKLAMKLQGQQMGEYFGSSLLATDINSDGRDDLIVGAPLYTYKPSDKSYTGYDEGRIYVYVNNKKGILEHLETDEPIMGSIFPGARFGSSLTDVGDINRDGFKDIAVGAPYEDGKGAIYIYHGSFNGLEKKCSQKILAKDISLDLIGFGISITRGLDIDKNSFNDIAVGSYASGHVVIIRSHPIIEFHATIDSSMDQLSINTQKFNISACLRYTTNADTDILQTLEATMRLRVDPSHGRATFQVLSSKRSSQGRQTQLQRNINDCWQLTVILKENNTQVVQPIEIIMTFGLLHDARENKDFCSHCPITDPSKPSSVSRKIPFANGCKDIIVCRSDLKISATFVNTEEPFTIGSAQNITLRVEVTNSGDPAYLTRLHFTVPKETRLNRIPQTCYKQDAASDYSDTNQEILVCNLGNPLYGSSYPAKQKNTVNFDIDMKMVNIDTRELIFNMSANTASQELNNDDNVLILLLPLQLAADITITGRAIKEQIFVTNTENKQLDVFHMYEVTNFGPSRVEQVDMEFRIPVAVHQDSKDIIFSHLFEPSVVLKDQQFPCVVNGTFLPNVDEWMTEDNTLSQGSHEGDTDIDETLRVSRRRRRSILDYEKWQVDRTKTPDVPANRTMFVNCTGGDSSSLCLLVRCHAGPLIIPADTAYVNIKMNVKLNVLELLMKGKDMIKLTSVGRVSISNGEKYINLPYNRPNVANVHTNFLGQVTGEEVSSWILPLSVAAGILLLMILTTTLLKAGFFRRSDKEKLEALRNSAAKEDFGVTDDHVDCADDIALHQNDTDDTED